ncbi:MAG: hypothetical protein ACYTGL_09050 [Planctomycetota bacterium]|jgi:hypothetical protein
MSDDHVDGETQDSTAAVEQKLDELGLSLSSSIPYRLASMFPKLTGWGAKKDIRNKVKLIRNVEPKLPELLRSSEEVLYIAKGIQYSLLEAQFIGALWANMINQTVFIVTNLRVIMINSNSKGVPKHTYWMIYYSQIEKAKASFTGVLNLKLRDGKKLRFTGFTKQDRKTMPALFQEALEKYQQHGFNPDASQSREHLCNVCFVTVPKGDYACDDCGTTFWRPSEVALRSLIFPAWGDILMRHYPLAVMELIGYLFSWFIIFTIVDEAATPTDAIGPVAMVLLFAHGLDALATLMIANKGLTPRATGTPAPAVVSDIVE